MSAGKMTERIAVLRLAEGDDGYGGSPVIYAKLFEAWAEVTPVRASESERQGGLRDVQVYLFRLYRRGDVAAADVIEWAGRRFNVREVRLPPTREIFMTVVAETGVTL